MFKIRSSLSVLCVLLVTLPGVEGGLECLYVALGVCFWSDSDGKQPKEIILGQMGRGGSFMLFVSWSTGCSSPALLAIW